MYLNFKHINRSHQWHFITLYMVEAELQNTQALFHLTFTDIGLGTAGRIWECYYSKKHTPTQHSQSLANTAKIKPKTHHFLLFQIFSIAYCFIHILLGHLKRWQVWTNTLGVYKLAEITFVYKVQWLAGQQHQHPSRTIFSTITNVNIQLLRGYNYIQKSSYAQKYSTTFQTSTSHPFFPGMGRVMLTGTSLKQ